MKYKIKGTGLTLSEEQYKECQKRIKEEGLSDYLEVRLMDYRDLPSDGKMYDRVVSVGMLEHVGRENYQLYLDCVQQGHERRRSVPAPLHQCIKRASW